MRLQTFRIVAAGWRQTVRSIRTGKLVMKREEERRRKGHEPARIGVFAAESYPGEVDELDACARQLTEILDAHETASPGELNAVLLHFWHDLKQRAETALQEQDRSPEERTARAQAWLRHAQEIEQPL